MSNARIPMPNTANAVPKLRYLSPFQQKVFFMAWKEVRLHRVRGRHIWLCGGRTA